MSEKDLLRQIFFVYFKTTGDMKEILNIKGKEDTKVRGNRNTEEVLETEEITESEEGIWEDVMSGFFPDAASEEEIEEELDNMWND